MPSELDRVLGDSFGDPKKPKKQGLGSNESYGTSDPSNAGLSPGLLYAGGPETQQQGMRGKISQALMRRLGSIFDGLDLSKCGVYADPNCVEILSRMLETTFRDFQLAARRPSHIDPPFRSTPVDAASATPGSRTVLIPATGTPVTVVSFVVPGLRYRGEIVEVAMGLESAVAFDDIVWRILVDGIPREPWEEIAENLFPFPKTRLCGPIHLRSGQTVTIDATNLGAAAHQASARICGWVYPVRAETGMDDIRSTIVD